MAASSQPRIRSFKANAAIQPFTFVIFGATKDVVGPAGANGKVIGIYMGSAAAANGDIVEIALPGGGGKLKVSETIALGKYLTSTASGQGEVADAAGEIVGAVAYEDGVADDIIGVEIMIFTAHASDA